MLCSTTRAAVPRNNPARIDGAGRQKGFKALSHERGRAFLTERDRKEAKQRLLCIGTEKKG